MAADVVYSRDMNSRSSTPRRTVSGTARTALLVLGTIGLGIGAVLIGHSYDPAAAPQPSSPEATIEVDYVYILEFGSV